MQLKFDKAVLEGLCHYGVKPTLKTFLNYVITRQFRGARTTKITERYLTFTLKILRKIPHKSSNFNFNQTDKISNS